MRVPALFRQPAVLGVAIAVLLIAGAAAVTARGGEPSAAPSPTPTPSRLPATPSATPTRPPTLAQRVLAPKGFRAATAAEAQEAEFPIGAIGLEKAAGFSQLKVAQLRALGFSAGQGAIYQQGTSDNGLGVLVYQFAAPESADAFRALLALNAQQQRYPTFTTPDPPTARGWRLNFPEEDFYAQVITFNRGARLALMFYFTDGDLVDQSSLLGWAREQYELL